MNEIRKRINELSELMVEFDLDEASLEGDSWLVSFKKTPRTVAVASDVAHVVVEDAEDEAPEPVRPKGTPVASPMTGVYYGSSSPSAPPFVKEGDSVIAGQVVGLIEAMKVFNEITAPASGTVRNILVQNGQIVQPGDPLLYIE